MVSSLEADFDWQQTPQSNGRIDPNWPLLGSQANLRVAANAELLRSVWPHSIGEGVEVHCNAASVTTQTVSDLPGAGMAWHHVTPLWPHHLQG